MITKYRPKVDIKPYYPSVIDIETRHDGSIISIGFSWENRLSDTGFIREYKVFDSWSRWIEFYVSILEEYKGCKVNEYEHLTRLYAHNGGGFDWLSLIEHFDNNGGGAIGSGIMVSSKMIGCKVNIGDYGNIWLLDSITLLKSGLGDLSNIFEIDHKKLELDDRLPEQVFNEDKDLYYEYLKNDVMGLQEILYKFWSMIYELEGNIGQLPMTIASLAMRLWRMDLNNGMTIKTSWNEDLKEFERRSYTGGRVQVFNYGEHDNVSVHDINSLYPSVMIDGIFPTSYSGMWVDSFNKDDYGIYEIEFNQTNLDLPAVLRDEETSEFVYSGSGVYTHIEINLLLEVGGSIEVKQGYIYLELDNLFRDYVNKWYSRRKKYIENGNAAMGYICKFLLNSLYGKFGQKEYGNVIELASYENEEKWIENDYDYVDYGNYAIVKKPMKVDHMFTIIASMVTSLSRVKLYRFMMEAINNGYEVYYCDTDSVHSNGYEFNCDMELGSMKLEFTGRGIYLGRKLYELIDDKENRKVVAKGIGKSSHKLITDNDFKSMVGGSIKPVKFNVAPTVREILSGRRMACKFFERERRIRLVEK